MADDDLREFIRELLLRHQRVTQGMIEQLESNTRAIDAQRAAFVEEFREQRLEWVAELREQRREFLLESRAHREALFKMLDRLGGGEAGPASA